MNPIVQRVYEIGIIPVIAFNSVDEALPLCKALMDWRPARRGGHLPHRLRRRLHQEDPRGAARHAAGRRHGADHRSG